MDPLTSSIRTHKALIDSDEITGRKLINQYEVIEEIGRGMHGKVKLARNLETGDFVAIKIIPRFSKKRRLGKVTAMSQQDKTRKEIAILKKIRHPNVVALLEVIDDPELKKIYMVLEHVELGEIVWRKKGQSAICHYERRRIETEMRGDVLTAEELKYNQILERRQAIKELKRAKMAQQYGTAHDFWSMEYGAADDSSAGRQTRVSSREDFAVLDDASSAPNSRRSSRAPSRSVSALSVSELQASTLEGIEVKEDDDDDQTPGLTQPNSNSLTGLEGTMYGAYAEENSPRGRTPSMADSIISHMSSVDFNEHSHDAFSDDYSYVPCFTFDQARSAFRDTLLGLEYLHYQGVVHRDIKPANLLWTKDHRVKISDFGVSYFGRPIRDGDQDDFISESEAKDFDDDRELAKTVGTPAFFAPELCYTDIDKEPPKVTEQIDVWSLGVTLFCLIFARIPFLAEDEFQMFRKIATEDIFIPRRRLKPVSPCPPPAGTSLHLQHSSSPYRSDDDLEYEELDDLLLDLMRMMFIKNPEQRIRLRDIKRHPWVVQGIPNPLGWIDDTDPARPSSGRRIQVDEREMSSAVVPLTLLERARSVVRKAVTKVMHPLVDRSESRSRRRATSSANSSAGDSMFNAPPTPQQRNERRQSLRTDDYFASAAGEGSKSALATDSPYDPMATVLAPLEPQSQSQPLSPEANREPNQPVPFHRHDGGSGQAHPRLSYIRCHGGSPIASVETRTTPATPDCDRSSTDPMNAELRRARGMGSDKDDLVRSQSVDRGLFASSDKHAQALVSLNTTVAPGSLAWPSPKQPRAMKSVDLCSRSLEPSTTSPLPASHGLTKAYQHGQSYSDPKLDCRFLPLVAGRPQTAHRTTVVPDAQSPPPRVYNTSNPGSFARAQELLFRKQELELEMSKSQSKGIMEVDPVNVPCPPSPDDFEFDAVGPLTRGDAMTTASSTDSMVAIGTPLTSPSETTSPVSSYPPGKNPSDRPLTFQSDPSLPALLSGASSMSADLEGEYLGKPGIVDRHPPLLETSDSLTPPALTKEPSDSFPMDGVFANEPALQSGPLSRDPDHRDLGHSDSTGMTAPGSSDGQDEDDDGDSDEGLLLMASSKKKSPVTPGRRRSLVSRRRDTNMSAASDETARKVAMHEPIPPSTDS